MLKQVFTPCGEVVHVKIPVGKRCGFVQYANRLADDPLFVAWVDCKFPFNTFTHVITSCIQIFCRGGVGNSARHLGWWAECEAFMGSQPIKQTSSGNLSLWHIWTFLFPTCRLKLICLCIIPASTGLQPVGWS
jgi:hypothetical protein